jgi:hypothetical protein
MTPEYLNLTEEYLDGARAFAKRREQLRAEGKWSQFISMSRNCDAANDLLDIIENKDCPPSRLWPVIGEAWVMSNGIMEDWDTWLSIWSYAFREDGTLTKSHRNVMLTSDRRVFDSLPKRVRLYRGCHDEDSAEGFSWTLDRSVAVFFARRVAYQGEAVVAQITVNRKHILAYFGEREEQEVVLHPRAFRRTKIMLEQLPSADQEAA